PLTYLGRRKRSVEDWLRLPVSGVSCRDAEDYVRWLARTDRVPGARLCTELEWERAARGADGRVYPHGDGPAPDDANFDKTYPGASGPDEVGSHPVSRSPFGLDDMAGNVWEWTTSERGCVVRGGAFYFDETTVMSSNRQFYASDL